MSRRLPQILFVILVAAAAGKLYVLAGDGLWKKTPGQNPVRVTDGEGSYANPLTTPDGLWVVAAKTDEDWASPNHVVRLDLKTGREYRVRLPPATQFAPVAYVAAHGKVLLRRARDDNSTRASDGPAAPEYHLLDAATGRTELVTGEVAPLLQEDERPLQPTGRPDEFWAAVPDRAKNLTRVGRYNVRDFSFRNTSVVPHLAFGSMSMWVDEAGDKLYVVYGGQLLRLPFRGHPPPKADRPE